MKITIDTIEHAALLIGSRPASVTCSGGPAPMTLLRVTSCGIHRDGRPWIGFDHHHNDNGREVVAPSVVFFLPVTIESLTHMVGAEGGAGVAGDRCEPGNECGRAGCEECQQ